MRRWIAGMLAMVILVAFTAMPVMAGKADVQAEIDIDSFVLYADFLVMGDEEPYEIGPLVLRFDASIMTDPNMTFEQLEQSCDRAAGALYRNGEYAGIVLFELKEGRWVCYQIIKPDQAYIKLIEQYGTDFLWPYQLGGNVLIQSIEPYTVFYFSELFGTSYPKSLSFKEYMQCISCEIDKFGYMENRTLVGVYDTEDIAYAAEYWDSNWFKENATLLQLLGIIGGIAFLAFGIDRLLILREKQRGKRK